MSFTHLFKVWTWVLLIFLKCEHEKYCHFAAIWQVFSSYEYLQFSTMWILWDQKCECGFFQIQDSSNYSSPTRDLTRFFGICDLEKPILTFPPHSILSLEISDILQKSNGIFGKNAPLHSVLDIQIVPQQHHAKFLQRGGDRVGPRLTEDYGNTGCQVFKWGVQNLGKCLPKNPHTQRKLLNFENWCNG